MSHPKDEAIMVKCLAQGHKRRDRPGRDSNPHSDNTRTWDRSATTLYWLMYATATVISYGVLVESLTLSKSSTPIPCPGVDRDDIVPLINQVTENNTPHDKVILRAAA